MNIEIEGCFIKEFVRKKYHDRMLFELSKQKNRSKAFYRLDNGTDCLCKEYMFEIPKPNTEVNIIYSLLKLEGAGDKSYLMSCYHPLDGNEMPLKDALKQIVGNFGMASIIYCPNEKVAFFQGEQSFGSPKRYILKRK